MCGAWRRTAVGGRGLADLSVRNPLRSGPCWPVSLIGDCVGIWACKAPRTEFRKALQLGHYPVVQPAVSGELRRAGAPGFGGGERRLSAPPRKFAVVPQHRTCPRLFSFNPRVVQRLARSW